MRTIQTLKAADVFATRDSDSGEWAVMPVSTTAFEWFSVLFNPKQALADGSYCVKSLEPLRVRRLKIRVD